jgi:hypothetical protein
MMALPAILSCRWWSNVQIVVIGSCVRERTFGLPITCKANTCKAKFFGVRSAQAQE